MEKKEKLTEHEFKSKAKAIGLKSTFILNDSTLYITSFGDGNKAIHEKDIVNCVVRDINNNFNAESKNNYNYLVSKDNIRANVHVQNPKFHNQLHAKDTIEEMFFGKSYNDNIHIQIAYNIMDIKKLISNYTNFAVQAINSMFTKGSSVYATKDNEPRDFLGLFVTLNDLKRAKLAKQIIDTEIITGFKDGMYLFNFENWKKVCRKQLKSFYFEALKLQKTDSLKYGVSKHPSWKAMSDYLILKCGWTEKKYIYSAANDYKQCEELIKSSVYFSDAFSAKNGNPDIEKCYNIVSVLGKLRQSSYHHDMINEKMIFDIDKLADDDMRLTLDDIFDQKIQNVNNKFLSTNAVNLKILFEIFDTTNEKEITKNYYKFIVKKDFENLGVSVKTLRETLLKMEDYNFLTEKSYDSVRNKLYGLIDYLIYDYLKSNADYKNMVKELRELYDKSEKEELYKKYSEKLSKTIGETVKNKILDKISADKIKEYKKDDFDEELKKYVEDIITKPEEMSYFSKAVYAFCLFLDGKEINMFLTDLIKKFDNITSFIGTLEEIYKPDNENYETEFEYPYKIFKDSAKIVEELRMIKSIARMNKGVKAKKTQKAKIKECQYYDSMAILGLTDKQEVRKLFHLDDTNCSKSEHALRNFFINNIINSNRFHYIVRIMDPQNARLIMKNETIVSFVLENIPESQIKRYANDTHIKFDENEPDFSVIRNSLQQRLCKLSYKDFLNVKQMVEKNSDDEYEKQEAIAILGLYMTVLYLVIKNLVRINTKYTIALGTLERDCAIMNKKYNTQKYTVNNGNCITEDFIKNGYIKAHTMELIEENKKYYSDDLFKFYRNQIVHMSVLANFHLYCDSISKVDSYFDLYHTIMGRIIANNVSSLKNIIVRGDKTVIDCLQNYNSAFKDFIYGINIPFAYNAARYINLSNKTKFLEGFGK